MAATAFDVEDDAVVRRLTPLRRWLAALPIGRVDVEALDRPGRGAPAAGAAVRLHVRARFGRGPLSEWVDLGERTLAVAPRDGRWKVTDDVTALQHRPAGGLAVFGRPIVHTSRDVTVVAPDGASDVAGDMFETARRAVPKLRRQYGGGAVSRHPVIFVVADRAEGERLAGIRITRRETPLGWQAGAFVYLAWPQWRKADLLSRETVVVHELTHVATRSWMRDVPQSLVEGVATDREERYAQTLGWYNSLLPLAVAYRQGLPSVRLWQRRGSDWGIANPRLIGFAYEDGWAVSHAVAQHHGGAQGLRRLAAAFARRARPGRHFSAADVDAAFRDALGVPFADVRREALAYARAHS